MKKYLLFLILLPLLGFSQQTPEFSFELYFEDAVGNRDTIILGHSPFATPLIDTSFGEENIANTPWDSVFEVRATDEFWIKEGFNNKFPYLFHTKKQILNKDGVSIQPNIAIDIKAQHWPVTVSWDSTLFLGGGDTTQYVGSWMTPIEYGIWFDGGSLPFFTALTSKTKISPNYQDLPGYNNRLQYHYITTEEDTIYPMWFYFTDSTSFGMLSLSSEKTNSISLSPNPFVDYFEISGIDFSQIKEIEVFNLLGEKQKINILDNRIYLWAENKGIYFVAVELKNSKKRIFKMIKL